MKRASSGHYLWQEARWQVTKLKHRRVAEMGLIQDRVSLSTKGLGELDGKTVREKGIKLVYLITKYSQLHSKPLALAITRGRQPRIVNWQWGGICNCWVNFGSCPPLMTHERAPLSPLKMSLPKFIIAVKEGNMVRLGTEFDGSKLTQWFFAPFNVTSTTTEYYVNAQK